MINMKKALIVLITVVLSFALTVSAICAEDNSASDETSAVSYQSEGTEAKKLEWLYYVIGIGTVSLVIGAAVIISKKR